MSWIFQIFSCDINTVISSWPPVSQTCKANFNSLSVRSRSFHILSLTFLLGIKSLIIFYLWRHLFGNCVGEGDCKYRCTPSGPMLQLCLLFFFKDVPTNSTFPRFQPMWPHTSVYILTALSSLQSHYLDLYFLQHTQWSVSIWCTGALSLFLLRCFLFHLRPPTWFLFKSFS